MTLRDARALPPRWCIFLADLAGGGAERMMVELARGFVARGFAVDIVLVRAEGPYLDEVPESVRVIDLGAGRVARAIPPFVAYLRRERPQVVFSTLPHASLGATVARVLARVPVTFVLREATTPSRRRIARNDVKARLQNLLMRLAYRAADGVVAVSEGVAQDLGTSYGVPERKIWTLYSPVVTPDIDQKLARDPDHPWMSNSSIPVVVGMGVLLPHKGFRTLLEAVAKVRVHRQVRLIVLGEGAERDELEGYAHELGLDECVAFVGFRSNPFSYLARAAVFVLASEREGLPGAMIQALACGCPVVATDCPSGPAEILEDGAYGRLVPVGDSAAMSDAIAATLDEPRDPERAMARAARFRSDRVVDAHIAAFERATTARRQRRGDTLDSSSSRSAP